MAFRNVCFTVNNPPDDAPLEWPSFVLYGVYQLERGDNGTLHWQGYAELNNSIKLAALKKWLPTAHFERRKGTDVQARDYCMKRDDTYVDGPWEHGTFVPASKTQGQRTDIEDACKHAAEHGMAACAAMYPAAYAKFFKGIAAYVNAVKRKPTDAEFEPRPWQRKVLDMLLTEPDPRTILWVYETRGNVGKSRLAHHLCCEHRAVELHGKIADMAYGYNDAPIVIFDLARTQEDHYKHLYAFAEKLKNGRFFNTKYESGMRLFNPPHVVFFANFAAPRDAWSADRLKEIDLACPDNHV